MNHVERFHAVMSFQRPDRLPLIEWAGWWDQTVNRWHAEGLPADLTGAAAIRAHLGLDRYLQYWIGALGPKCPGAASHGSGIIADAKDYDRIRPHLYPDPCIDDATFESMAREQKRGDAVVWITLEGFFWFARTLLGIERHLFAFYDDPKLMHRINGDLTEFNLRVIREVGRHCAPDFMTFAEDLSYNHGPMLSKHCFDEYMAPYYRRVVPALSAQGTIPMIDSDGDIHALIPWFEEVGLEGILPLERMAGVDVNRLRKEHPRWKMIGAFDKTVMKLGEGAMRREFERLLPVMRSGGYIPAVDHQTPPDVSLDTYHVYVSLLREYGEKAVR